MRIAVVTHSFPYGDGEDFLGPEIEALVRAGACVDVIPVRARSGAVRRAWDPSGVTVRHRPFGDLRFGAVAGSRLLSNPRKSLQILRILLRDPRHLHVNLAVLPQAVAISEEIASAEHVHAHWLSTSATAAMFAAMLADKPWSVTAHRWDVVDANLAREKVQRAKFVRVISLSGQELLKRVAPGAEPVVIHMGVEIPERIAATSHASLRVAVPANLVPVKGHQFLLDAVCRVRSEGLDIQVDLFGDGPLRSGLEGHVRQLGLCHVVKFWGKVGHGALLERYRDGYYDIVALPSLDLGGGLHEGIPVSLMEAMAAGVAVISTPTGGIPELVQDNISGLLVRPGDAADLARAFWALRDDSLRLRLATAARSRVIVEFSVDGAAARILSEALDCS